MGIFSNEKKNMRLSQKKDSLMFLMHSQIDSAKSPAISDKVVPEIQIICGLIVVGTEGRYCTEPSATHLEISLRSKSFH